MWSTSIVGVIISIIGLFLFLFPEKYWELAERWKSYYANEPSELYLISTKFGGIGFIILGICMIIGPFISK